MSVLDTACARLALGQNSIPAAIEDAKREIDDLAVQTRVLEREAAWARTTRNDWRRSRSKKAAAEERLKTLNERFDKERDLVTKIRELRGTSWKAEPPNLGEGEELRKELEAGQRRSWKPCRARRR